MRRKRRKYGQAGFTLVEMLVVLVIVGALVALIAPNLMGRTGEARQQAAAAQIRNFKMAIDQFQLDMRRVPTEEEGLDALVRNPGGDDGERWKGPYLRDTEKVPADPWDNEYVYTCPGDNGRDCDIVSLGRDGRTGGDGEDKDITSWLSDDG